MQLSAFNLYVEDYPEHGSTLVHNTFSGAYVVLADETLRALRNLDVGDVLADTERELVDGPGFIDPDVAIVVHSHEAEEQEYRDWFERGRSHTESLQVILGVNLACNFECPYCCQADVLDGRVMSRQVAGETAAWLCERALQSGVGAVHPVFVGGEPLLHVERVKQIARGVREGLADSGIEFGFSLITNGYFLSPQVVQDLCALGLRSVQVTLDGNHETHSLTRVSKKGEDTFQRIFDNVVAASRHVQIRLNGNYEGHTVHGFAPLIRELAEAGLPNNAKVLFGPALDTLSSREGAGIGSCSWTAGMVEQHVQLQDEVLRSGFARKPMHSVGPCSLHERESFAIDPSGTIYICPGFMGLPEWGVGDVHGGLTGRENELLAVNPQHECGACSHRPNCAGGCVANEWIAAKHPEGVSCSKPYLDAVKNVSVVREYLLATEPSLEAAITRFPEAVALAATGAAVHSSSTSSTSRGRRSAALRIL